ncbi:uracil-DNA degrading factor [Haematobia irritans]|uniref:uracil-DNA degrading factor n=1 Tax=Haematobia irritans TaxID=7368 RepID=UPI003F5062BB
MADKEDSKFGFKNKEKAEETLVLLESHDMQYRKLTVRGLLGRAKRVLSMTKAEDKVKNINDAIEVFEKWLSENGGDAANKNAKTSGDDKVETVPGLGFKDKEAAEKTLKILEDRDPEYQKLAIKGLIGSSKRVLSGTKNEEKIQSIKDGVQILEDFLEKFETENLIKNNRAYFAYDIIAKLPQPEDKLQAEFLKAYGGPKAKGNYKHLRTMYPEEDDTTSWDIIRNRNIAKILAKIKEEDAKLFDDTGKPSDLHMQLIHWAYSPQPDKVKSYASTLKTECKKAEKRKCEDESASGSSSSDDDESDDDDEKMKEDKEDKEENGESPAKKAKMS